MAALHLAEIVSTGGIPRLYQTSFPSRSVQAVPPSHCLPPSTRPPRGHRLHSSGGKAVGGITWLTTYSLTVRPLTRGYRHSRRPLRCPTLWVAARSLDDRSDLTASSAWVCGTPTNSTALLRSGAQAIEGRPLGDFHFSCGGRISSGGMLPSRSPPSPVAIHS